VDVRIVSSTNEKLESIIGENRFRPDLYYRLAVLVLEIPGLSERKKDIPVLTNYFIGRYSGMFGRKIRKVSPDVYDALAKCQWPGNVRELESVVASAVCMADEQAETLEYRHFANRLNFAQKEEIPVALPEIKDSQADLADLVSGYEKTLIRKALSESEGNITKAAALLNVPRQTLSRKVREYGLQD
jgi:arginine utilization regulatory protein